MKKQYIIGLILIGLLLLANITIIIYYRNDPFPKYAKKASDAIVLVKFKDPNGEDWPLGTGFIVDKKGYILTAKHNFDEPSSISGISTEEFVLKFGYIEIKKTGKEFKVTQIKNDSLEIKDVLLLKINENLDNLNLRIIKIAEKEEVPATGAEVGFVGYTTITRSENEYDLFISKGILSNDKLPIKDQIEPFYTVNAFSTFGYSGGPIFLSKNGKAIGLVEQFTSKRYPDTGKKFPEGIVIVPPIHEVPSIIAELEKKV